MSIPSEDYPIDCFIVPQIWCGFRLDKLLSLQYKELHSRNYFEGLIKKRLVFVNGKAAEKKGLLVETGWDITVYFENLEPPEIEPEDIPLEIVFEDEHLVVINKPPGMVVHPAPGNWTGTIVNALMFHCQKSFPKGELRPGIVHRLDKDTTGLLVAAKNAYSSQKMTELFSSRRIRKEYLALCIGNPSVEIISAPIGRHPVERKKMAVQSDGREAVTHLKTLSVKKGMSVVLARLETGRTHQIRVHLHHIGCPILGDSVYGSEKINQRYGAKRQMLHAWKLNFMHPITREELSFSVSPPGDMRFFIEKNY